MSVARPHTPASGRASERRAHRGGAPIATRLLLAAGPFGPRLPAAAVAAASARGIEEAGRPAPDVLELSPQATRHAPARSLLDGLDFDARMRGARAVVLAWELLEQRALADSVAFEIATRARQAGVPSYAITRQHELGAFGARMLDLQLVLLARSARGLTAAGRALGAVA